MHPRKDSRKRAAAASKPLFNTFVFDEQPSFCFLSLRLSFSLSLLKGTPGHWVDHSTRHSCTARSTTDGTGSSVVFRFRGIKYFTAMLSKNDPTSRAMRNHSGVKHPASEPGIQTGTVTSPGSRLLGREHPGIRAANSIPAFASVRIPRHTRDFGNFWIHCCWCCWCWCAQIRSLEGYFVKITSWRWQTLGATGSLPSLSP